MSPPSELQEIPVATREQSGPIQRWKSSIQSAKTRAGVNYSSDNELVIAKCKLKLKKVGKTIRTFGYDVIKSLWVYSGGDK